DGAALLARDGQGLDVVGSHHLPESVRGLAAPRVVVQASGSRHLLAAPSLPDDERFEPPWRRAAIGSLLAIPVPGHTGVVLLALFLEPRSFAPEDLALAEQL